MTKTRRASYPGMNIPTAAAPMIPVAIQPRIVNARPAVKEPITDLLRASGMMTTMRGTAATPSITALQNKAFIGLIGEYG